MKKRIKHSFSKHIRGSFLLISLLIFSLDATFVAINYYSARDALYQNLTDRARAHSSDFNITLQMTYRNLEQMSELISHDEKLNRLFLQGKRAIGMGGELGSEIADLVRQELLEKIKPAWDGLMERFDVRQLHYHLGPGSLSFLRVHRPEKYGDRMDDLRFTIVDTNAEKTGRIGFETGRIYSGLRSVSPVWACEPVRQKRTTLAPWRSAPLSSRFCLFTHKTTRPALPYC
ncbi:MAG: hypothetical protein JXR59_04280 [Desulfuromonadaceae bacterium]|nr:hypothetical protein [Desulfuromonadaceae bacterium]